MSPNFTEADYEDAIIELFTKYLNYNYVYAPTIERDNKNPLYEDMLFSSLCKINKNIPTVAINEAISKLKDLESGNLLQKNMAFMNYLQNGMEIKYFDGKEELTVMLYIVDFKNVNNNDFTIANQWTFVEHSEKRPDIILFINGLPLVIMELKSPSREDTDVSSAYRQLRNYTHEIPSMFYYNTMLVMSDLATSKLGTITSGENRFMEWKTIDGSYEKNRFSDFNVFFQGVFQKERFLDLIKNFICFNVDGEKTFKIVAGYHQYFAVNKAVEKAILATESDGKGGVFWHTQGSGKSLSMVFYAHLLQQKLNNPTIVVITDRNDLDNQLFSQFSRCSDFLRQTPLQATNRENLTELLDNRQTGGIIFTTMQKFEENDKPLSERRNIVVMADEAHRGQYGLTEKVVVTKNDKGEDESRNVIGTARIIRNSLPNATYIGFTGTPISSKDRSTREVFGDYIDIYDMTQAVEDGATKPVYYESRVIKLSLDEDTLKLIDNEYETLSENTEEHIIEKSKKQLGSLESVLGAEQTVNSLVDDILNHYENNRQNLLTGKAMIVAYSRPIAMKIYKRILEIRPTWTEKVGVVMTGGNDDPEEWREIIGNKTFKTELATKFKDDTSDLKIAIVVDMWLTGFDVPSLATMYVYKPMQGHNLMQAIARVNRVFEDKQGGLVVDYVGIAKALKQAMNDYTQRDKENYGDTDIHKNAYPLFLEKLEICKDLIYGFDYSLFQNGTNFEKAGAITGCVDFILAKNVEENNLDDKEKTQNIFIKETLMLKQALSLCSSLVDKDTRFEAAYFDAVRTMLMKVISDDENKTKPFTLPEINDRINELLTQSVQNEGVINLFADTKSEFSLFDPKFLDEVANMKQKNLAIELLKKLIKGQVKGYQRTNVVKAGIFSEKIQTAMNQYLNGMITNEEVIEELLRIAKDIAEAHKEGEKLGLSKEEMAFFDALTKPRAIKDFYEHEQLIALTRELTNTLQGNSTIDWKHKETARASMRKMIKRLLKKYKYPPDELDVTLDTVITQCELWTDNIMIV